ncbi:type II toxin-antitoxin system HipA family toxin [Leclercia adecarboxylata]|uniref:type II toxin-antitoxin system HipA family toxin n=1 Tax=Leclercia adecarboxylata TaxID=83655 RepID=UPI0013FD70BF|nr:type II toxin-antitoxin system HipA family toxin [Leclercia adecarboxylata]QIM42796.1 type II toxin-antitoxin system HipA family toxin [Leclercia adecarboxylata]
MRAQRLTVAMNGDVVGTLHRDGSGAMSFQYAPEWLAEPGSRAISLSLPLQHGRIRGAQVFNFFSNLLPDSEAIIARMQARFQVETAHPSDLLASVGRDCVGAIQLYPPGQEIPPVTDIVAEPLDDDQIAALLDGYQMAPLGMTEEDADFRISLAGAQEKTALLWYQARWQRPQGSTPTSHIFKLPIGRIEQNNIDLSESCENEWLCLRIAKAFGFPVAQAEMATFGRKKVLIIERFDRRWSSSGWLMRLPQEDFCQALGVSPALKYESHGGPGIADAIKLLLGSRLAGQDRELFFKAQILFWMLAAIDGHGKNFSLFIEADSAFRMAPLFDAGGIPVKKAKMAMALQGKNRQYHFAMIQPRHFISTAAFAGYSQEAARRLLAEMAERTDDVIASVRAELPPDFPAQVSEAIFKGLASQAARIGRFVS